MILPQKLKSAAQCALLTLGLLILALVAAPAQLMAQSDAMPPEGISTLLLMANARTEAGDHQGALEYYRRAWESWPGQRSVGERYAESAVAAGRPREGLSILGQLQTQAPEDLDLALNRMSLLLQLGDLDQVLRVNAGFLEIHPEEPRLLELRLRVLAEKGRDREALKLLDQLEAQVGEEASIHMQRGILLLNLGEDPLAEIALRRALEMDPEMGPALEQLGGLMESQGREGELLSFLKGLLDPQAESSVDLRMRMADLYLASDQPDSAARILLPLLTKRELDPSAQLLLAGLLEGLGRDAEALPLVQELLGQGYESTALLRLAAEVEAVAGDVKNARQHLQRLLDRSPEDADAALSLLLLRAEGRPGYWTNEEEWSGEGGRLLQLAIDHYDADSLRQNWLLGTILRRRGRDAEAIGALQRAEAKAPENPQVLFDLAVAFQEEDQPREAAKRLERLLELEPEDPEILNFYGYLLADEGWELERAEKMIRRALLEEPKNPFYLDSLGWVLFGRGKYESALDELISATNVLGDDPTVLEHVGDTLRALGRADEAATVYRRALESGGEADRLEPRLRSVGVEP